MALGIYMIMFVEMAAISIAGLILLCFLKSEKAKKWIFYFMTAWAMVIAVISARSAPVNDLGRQLTAWGLGFLGAAGLFLYLKREENGAKAASYALAALSTIGGTLFLFF